LEYKKDELNSLKNMQQETWSRVAAETDHDALLTPEHLSTLRSGQKGLVAARQRGNAGAVGLSPI